MADVVIVGGGPAGISTAIQLVRYGVRPLLFEQARLGGLVRNAGLVENYPGFPDGISGPDLADLLSAHLGRAGVEVRSEGVIKLDRTDQGFEAETGSGCISARVAVIATGTKPKRLAVPMSDDVAGRVWYDIHSIRLASNERIAVIGGGDVAFDYALSLSKHNEVAILSRGEGMRCLPVLAERCAQVKNVSYLERTVVRGISATGTGLSLLCDRPGQRGIEICADRVVVAVGREPALDFLGDRLRTCVGGHARPSALYLVGDVRNDRYRQVSICVGDGVESAMRIHEEIRRAGKCA